MVVLGICDGHDAGAALVIDGNLVFAASEERFARRKRAQGFPRNSIAAALAWAGLEPRQVDVVAVGGIGGRGPYRLLDRLYRRASTSRSPLTRMARLAAAYENEWTLVGRPLGKMDAAATRWGLRTRLRASGLGRSRLRLVDHHAAHLAAAALMLGPTGSDGPRHLRVSLDGFGDGRSGALALGASPSASLVGSVGARDSLGLVYGIVTALLGFDEGDEGKVLGLAAHGDPEVFAALFEKAISIVDANRYARWRVSPEILSPRFWEPVHGANREDIAAGLQKRVETVAVWLVESYMEQTRAESLACAGGVFANVALNGKLAAVVQRLGGDLAVFPHMGDGGLCVGAAAEVWSDLDGATSARAEMPPFWGPAYDPAYVAEAARTNGLRVKESADVHEEIARRLAAGKVIARFEGRLEFGPRALGARSILFSATDRPLAAKVNATLGRPGFMPFAPALLADESGGLLDSPPPAGCAALMTATAHASPAMREKYPVAVHVDGTSRPQIVDGRAADLEKILLAYRRATGHGLTINTSFNRHTEPIVCTPEDAVDTFLRCPGLDALAAGPYVIDRE